MESDDLLARIERQLKGLKAEKKGEPIRVDPPVIRRLVFFEFLETERKKTPETVYVHKYEPIVLATLPDPVGIPDTHCVVLHGHAPGISCYAPHFCHELGYRPTGKDTKHFYRKWSYNVEETPPPAFSDSRLWTFG